MAFKICGQEPTAVTTGDVVLYIKSGQVCIKDDTLTETCFITSGAIPSQFDSITVASNIASFRRADNSVIDTLDLSSFLDDTNLERIESAVPVAGDQVELRRGDNSVAASIDLSPYVNLPATPRHEVFDADGGVALTAAYQIVTMESEVNTETGFATSGGGTQVSNAGPYKYSFKVSSDSTDGDRATVQAAIFVDGVEVPRTRAFAYHRSVANGEDSATSSGVLVLAANAVVTVRALIFGDNVTTIANASNLTLEVNT